MNPLVGEQCRRNRHRDDHWRVAENHRRHVTERILALTANSQRRLCILGAGNANDLDLPAITAAFGEVHLVDIDGDALKRGLARQFSQGEEDLAKIRLHPGVDVTGICHELGALTHETSPADTTLAELVDRAANVPPLPLPRPFDVMVSAGLLSQLIDGVVLSVPATSASLMPLLLGVRSGHLRLLARLTAPGGHGLLITDFVSSATAPQLATASDEQVGELAERLAAAGNFFHGINPAFLARLFDEDAVLRALVARVSHRGHWIWDQRSRQYAVMALEFERAM